MGVCSSLLLYIHMDESLSRKLEQEIVDGEILGLSIAINVKSLNHSQFVDDTLLFGGDSKVIDR